MDVEESTKTPVMTPNLTSHSSPPLCQHNSSAEFRGRLIVAQQRARNLTSLLRVHERDLGDLILSWSRPSIGNGIGNGSSNGNSALNSKSGLNSKNMTSKAYPDGRSSSSSSCCSSEDGRSYASPGLSHRSHEGRRQQHPRTAEDSDRENEREIATFSMATMPFDTSHSLEDISRDSLERDSGNNDNKTTQVNAACTDGFCSSLALQRHTQQIEPPDESAGLLTIGGAARVSFRDSGGADEAPDPPSQAQHHVWNSPISGATPTLKSAKPPSGSGSPRRKSGSWNDHTDSYLLPDALSDSGNPRSFQSEGDSFRVPTLHGIWQFGFEAETPWSRHTSVASKSTPGRRLFEARSGDVIEDDTCLNYFLIEPSDVRRLAWDVLSIVVITWDMMTFPLTVFNFDELDWAQATQKFSSIFWLLDLFFNFRVGFHLPDGRIEMRCRKIAAKYFRTWFALDFLVVASDVVLQILDTFKVVDLVRVGKTARLFRIARFFRMLRIVRLVRLVKAVERIGDFLVNSSLLTFLNITKLLVGLAVIVHFIACAWVAIGLEAIAGGHKSWMSGLVEAHVDDWYLYVVSFHWCMAQFTPAPNDFHPQNRHERLYAIFVLFLGLVLFSSLLGSTTALLNLSRREAMERMRESESLRRFLAENQVSLRLSNMIIGFLRQRRSRTPHITEADLPCLALLPRSMQSDLRYEVYSRRCISPLFSWMHERRVDVLVELCFSAMSEKLYRKGEEPFNYRKRGTHTFFVVGGLFSYFPTVLSSGTASHRKSLNSKVIQEGCLAETVLWAEWEHQGLIVSEQLGITIEMVAEDFFVVVERHHALLRFLRNYAQRYVVRMQTAADNGHMIDDTFQPFLNSDDVADGSSLFPSNPLHMPTFETLATQSHVSQAPKPPPHR